MSERKPGLAFRETQSHAMHQEGFYKGSWGRFRAAANGCGERNNVPQKGVWRLGYLFLSLSSPTSPYNQGKGRSDLCRHLYPLPDKTEHLAHIRGDMKYERHLRPDWLTKSCHRAQVKRVTIKISRVHVCPWVTLDQINTVTISDLNMVHTECTSARLRPLKEGCDLHTFQFGQREEKTCRGWGNRGSPMLEAGQLLATTQPRSTSSSHACVCLKVDWKGSKIYFFPASKMAAANPVPT